MVHALAEGEAAAAKAASDAAARIASLEAEVATAQAALAEGEAAAAKTASASAARIASLEAEVTTAQADAHVQKVD